MQIEISYSVNELSLKSTNNRKLMGCFVFLVTNLHVLCLHEPSCLTFFEIISKLFNVDS